MIATAIGKLAKMKGLLIALSGILVGLATRSLVVAIANLFSSPGLAGLASGIAGTAALYTAVQQAKSLSTADDMISSGYGDRILSTPKGSIALNNQDTVVAGTNLGGGNNESKRTNQLLERILTKQGTVSIDSTKAGTAFAMGTYQVQ